MTLTSLIFLFSLTAEASLYPSWSLILALASLASSKTAGASALRLQAPDEPTGFGGAIGGLAVVKGAAAAPVGETRLAAALVPRLLAVAGQ